ncbi:hypothetical protein NA56DRAFT_700384 [Hyaloscypha hepaticicola]|uniref:Uncharacterized protein n=1 Tax=Hyaloscypha hepaticicola TaxID=2082293 RepID=A0A2J6QEM3_9HELO|nr:hypothetical protein NA56DRAFT_700384 [Hyaloscypha hepaticicola]
MRIIFHLHISSHRFNSCPPPSKASSISPAVPSTCPIVNITQKYSPAANGGGPPPSMASSICPSTSSIVNSTEHCPSAAANAGGPPPSEASSLTFSIINSTKQVVNMESLDVSTQDDENHNIFDDYFDPLIDNAEPTFDDSRQFSYTAALAGPLSLHEPSFFDFANSFIINNNERFSDAGLPTYEAVSPITSSIVNNTKHAIRLVNDT